MKNCSSEQFEILLKSIENSIKEIQVLPIDKSILEGVEMIYDTCNKRGYRLRRLINERGTEKLKQMMPKTDK